MTILTFPDEFRWGTATSSQQIEGGVGQDGRGESIWDRFASIDGRIEDGSKPDVTCDHVHRWREDIALMRGMGCKTYRFSVSWSRLFPNGDMQRNPQGFAFYDLLIDGLLEAGIEPCITLYHWDMPQALEDRGGWVSRTTAEAFVEYASAVAQAFGDRVKQWVTHNEPWCISCLGYEEGHHAPGRTEPAESLKVAHHLLLSHAWAMQAIRDVHADAEVGIVLNLTPATPATDSEADHDAARWFDGFFNRWFLEPLFHAQYPADSIRDRIERGHLDSPSPSFIEPADLQTIASRMDFLGVNYYSRVVMTTDEEGKPKAVPHEPAAECTQMGWEVYPEGLEHLLVRLNREYDLVKVIITENGAAFDDPAPVDGQIDDPRRIEYLQSHLSALHRAIAAGVPVKGYFLWSLLDNFEWGHGFLKHFGVHAIEPGTLNRIPKRSSAWYRDVIAHNAVDDRSGSPLRSTP